MKRIILSALVAIAATGCATKAPPYQASIDNVEAVRKAELKPMQMGKFVAAPNATGATSISLRGSAMASPAGEGYADYLAAALRQELELARLLNDQSMIEVSGVLLKNDIAAGGIRTNSGEIEARFTVRRDGALRYEVVKRAELTWESSLVGAIAIPLARQNYPKLVRKLIGELVSDAAFVAACK